MKEKLLQWYDEHKRELPWRSDPTPYHVMVSEIMLQQTRVVTVLPYYQRFIEELPTIQALAEVSEEKLHQLWAGLGYYSRARNLKVAAQQIQELGYFPSSYTELLTLKGIGPYTAGAIASIAFQEAVPAVDGNVLRVYTRLYQIKGDIKKARTVNEVRKVVEQTISHTRPGDFNQALMDLGSEICTPKSPRCLDCPLQEQCLSFQQNTVLDFPEKGKKIEKKEEYFVAMAYHNEKGEYYFLPPKEKGLLQNMRLFPLEEVSKEKFMSFERYYSEKGQVSLLEPSTPYLSSLATNQEEWHYAGEVKHIFTHKVWHILVLTQKVKESTDFGGYQLNQVPFALCKLQEKMNQCIEKSEKGK